MNYNGYEQQALDEAAARVAARKTAPVAASMVKTTPQPSMSARLEVIRIQAAANVRAKARVRKMWKRAGLASIAILAIAGLSVNTSSDAADSTGVQTNLTEQVVGVLLGILLVIGVVIWIINRFILEATALRTHGRVMSRRRAWRKYARRRVIVDNRTGRVRS